MPPDTIPDEAEIALNTPVLLFALAISALDQRHLRPGAGAAQPPAATSRTRCAKPAAAWPGGSRQAILRKALVVAEVALSLMLLAGSSVLLRTFVAMQAASTSACRPTAS